MRVEGPNFTSAARRLATFLAAICAALAFTAQAQAYSVADGWVASDYATGFPHIPDGVGPAGLAFDAHANLLVTDPASETLYRIPAGGGSAEGHALRDGFGHAAGLAFDLDGRLYMARRNKGDVVEVDPGDGHYIRTVVSGMPCPVGLATDPIGGDLFVSNNFCPGGGIKRITGHKGGSAVARTYAGDQDADGLTFAPDGALYAAGGVKVVRIDGTSSATPGRVTDVAGVPSVDGIVYAPATARDDAYLVVNRNDGEIDRLDFDGTLTAVVSGGSRGDLVTVGPDRCIYATQQDRVIKLGPSTGLCNFSPPVQPPAGGRGGVLGSGSKRVVDTAVRVAGPRLIRRGSRFTYKLRVRNAGPGTAHRVVVTNRLPFGLRVLNVKASTRRAKCARKGRVLTCRIATLRRGKSFTIAITVRALTRAAYVNRVTVRSADLDPAPGNNRGTARTKVYAG
jgi:uncharacterized repeat protein (TIGR01451 family)